MSSLRDQIALPAPELVKDWGVWINETSLQSTGHATFWVSRRPMWEMSGQLVVLQIGFLGDNVIIGPLTRDDAEFACGHLVEHGAPAKAVKVRHFARTVKASQR